MIILLYHQVFLSACYLDFLLSDRVDNMSKGESGSSTRKTSSGSRSTKSGGSSSRGSKNSSSESTQDDKSTSNVAPVKTHVEWPAEPDFEADVGLATDPNMPADLHGVIGYCSEKTMGELPGSLVSPTDIHNSVQEAKKYLFGSELEASMRASLTEYTKVCDIMKS